MFQSFLGFLGNVTTVTTVTSLVTSVEGGVSFLTSFKRGKCSDDVCICIIFKFTNPHKVIPPLINCPWYDNLLMSGMWVVCVVRGRMSVMIILNSLFSPPQHFVLEYRYICVSCCHDIWHMPYSNIRTFLVVWHLCNKCCTNKVTKMVVFLYFKISRKQ